MVNEVLCVYKIIKNVSRKFLRKYLGRFKVFSTAKYQDLCDRYT